MSDINWAEAVEKYKSPTVQPVGQPTVQPAVQPAVRPAVRPTLRPVGQPTLRPTLRPEQPVDWVKEVEEKLNPTPTTYTGMPVRVKQDIEGAADISDVAIASLAENADARINWYSKKMKIDRSRFGMHRGKIVYLDNDGELQAVAPGIARTIAKGTGPSFPAVAGAIGTVAGAPLAVPGMIAAGLAGAGTGQFFRDVAAKSLMDQPMSAGRVTREASLDFVASASGLLIGKGMSKAAATRAGKELGRIMNQATSSSVTAMKEALAAVNAKYGTEIKLTPAEITNLAKLRAQQMGLEAKPEQAQILEDYYAERGIQAGKAVAGFTEDISPSTSIDTAGEALAAKSRAALAAIKQRRVKLGSPVYRQAIKEHRRLVRKGEREPIDIRPAIKELDDVLKIYPGSKDTIENIRSMMGRIVKRGETERFIPHTDIEVIQNGVKEQLDDQVGVLIRSGKNKLANRLRNVQKTMLKALDDKSPKYAEARKVWGDLSRDVDYAEGGILPLLANKGSKDFEYMGAKFLSNASPAEITRARTHIMDVTGGEDVWNSVVRGFIEQQWEVAGRVFKSNIARVSMQKAAAPASLWAALVGNGKQYARVKAALSPNQAEAFDNLMRVFEATGRATNYNSTTAAQVQAQQMLDVGGRVTGTVKSILNPFGTLRRLETGFDEMIKDINHDVLVRTITRSDSVAELLKISSQATPRDKYALIVMKAINMARANIMGGPEGEDVLPGGFDPNLSAQQEQQQ